MVFPLASKHLEKSVVECNGFFSHVQIPSDLHGLLVGNHVKSECLILSQIIQWFLKTTVQILGFKASNVFFKLFHPTISLVPQNQGFCTAVFKNHSINLFETSR